RGEPVRERDPPGADADEDHVGQVSLAFRDLVGHPVHHAPDAVGIQNTRLLDECLGFGQSGGSLWAGSFGVNRVPSGGAHGPPGEHRADSRREEPQQSQRESTGEKKPRSRGENRGYNSAKTMGVYNAGTRELTPKIVDYGPGPGARTP